MRRGSSVRFIRCPTYLLAISPPRTSHFPFSIYHFLFSIGRSSLHLNEKWQMANGKWQMCFSSSPLSLLHTQPLPQCAGIRCTGTNFLPAHVVFLHVTDAHSDPAVELQ